MSCSARLPVYTVLISLVIPNKFLLGFLSLQGLVMMALYLLGFVMSLLTAYVLNLIIKVKERSIFLMELPVYRMPRWNNVAITMIQKQRFLFLMLVKLSYLYPLYFGVYPHMVHLKING